MKKFGIDTSRWQGDFDFAKAKKESGVEFAILKIGGGDDGLYKDREFEASYKKCVECGLDKGAYFFGHAMNMDEAKKEAAYFIELLKGKKFEYPVFYDVEGDMLSLGKNKLTDICLYVLKTVQDAGYWVGIYCSSYYFRAAVDDTKLKGFSHWVACYAKNQPVLESGSQLQMWQFGGEQNFIRSNKINGQTVDQNYCYVDYPAGIKAEGLNGFSKAAVEEVKKEEVKAEATTKYKVGDYVSYNKIYASATDTAAATPLITSGKITKVLAGKPHPYLINNGTGWVDDNCITPKKATTTTAKAIKKGDKVKVVNAITYDTGKPFKAYYNTYDVIEVNGNRAVIGIVEKDKNGKVVKSAITSAIDVKNLKKV